MQNSARQVEQLVILGTGPAGLTAAIYAARASLAPLCFEGHQPGGQLTITSEVENFPGFPGGILGPELMQAFRQQAEKFGARITDRIIQKVRLRQDPIEIETDQGVILTRALIIATGASAKWLGLPNEKRFFGKGLSACATCDAFFFKNLEVAVIGGGDSALEEALFLSRFANKVYLIHRRGEFRASKVMQSRVLGHSKIQVILNTELVELLGEHGLTGIRVRNLETQEVTEISLQGVFVAIGHQPNTQLFQSELSLNPTGYILTQPGSTKTQIPGVFAAGDVADAIYRQAITAAGTGCMAALDAERFLDQQG